MNKKIAAPVAQSSYQTSSFYFTPRSTTTKAQQVRLVEALRLRPHDTDELRKLGIFCPAPRVMELRKMGYAIHTHRITKVDSEGFSHERMGLYGLVSEPSEGGLA